MKNLFSLLVLLSFATSGLAQEEPKILDATDLTTLRDHADTEVVVEGFVTEIGRTKSNSITFINIGLPKKEGFVALIYEKDYSAFPEAFNIYEKKKVRVKGMLKLYRNETPQVVMTSPEQIEIVEGGEDGE
ncbi:MAG: hypothetical protein ACK5LK_05960 [Chthoniobacterales bacterium]